MTSSTPPGTPAGTAGAPTPVPHTGVDRRPTIRDVALAAGVSKSLVSLALRGEPRVSPEARKRITRAARELGYRSNALARGLVQGRTGLIGVLLTDLGNPYHTEVVDGIETAAERAGLRTVIGHGRRDRVRMAGLLESMAQLRVDGVVVVSSWVAPETLAACAEGLPVVQVGRPERFAPGVDTVTNDDDFGARLAVRHLWELGHRRIAHVGGGERPAAVARREGYRAAMAELGLRDLVTTEAADTLRDAGAEATARLLAGATRPTAVFAANDLSALGAVRAAQARGVAVPGSLSVVGYDNTALAELWRPALSSVDQPRRAMGALAFGMLAERLGGRREDRHETLTPTLVARESSAAPA